MSSELQPYARYKDSGVAWLGEVPEHWDVKPTKYGVTCNDNVLPDNTDSEYEFDYVEISNVGVQSGIRHAQRVRFSEAPSRARRVVRRGDVIVSTVRTYLRAIAPVDEQHDGAVVSTGFAVLRPGTLLSGYLGFCFQSEYVIARIIAKSVGVSYPATNATEILRIPVPFPPLPEQHAIADYLDAETGRIDTLICEQRELIELLKEKRQALISHCVTRGLDPDVPMKDSGVEWLGEVPEHWTIMKFGYAAAIAEGQVDPTVEPYRHMPLIAPDHIESRSGRLLSIETAEEQHAISGKYLCQRGDVIYSKIRPALMKACLAPAEGLCSADMYPLRPVSALLSDRFLLYILLSDHFTDFAVLQSQRVAMPKINREALRSFLLLIPPLPEQHAIADYLDAETARIDALITEAEETITLMQEHRSALISACVTGKVKVPGVADPAAQEQAV